MGPLLYQALQLTAVYLDAFDSQPVPTNDTYHHQQSDEPPEPPRLPKGRCDGDADGDAILVPDAVAVRTLDPKDIVSSPQVRIARIAARPSIHPVRIKSCQLVGIAVFLWRVIVQGRKLKGDKVVPVGELDVLVWGQIGAHHLVELAEGGNDDRRSVWIGPNPLWIERVKALDASKEQLSALAPEMSPDVELVVLQAVADVIVLKGLAARIEPG